VVDGNNHRSAQQLIGHFIQQDWMKVVTGKWHHVPKLKGMSRDQIERLWSEDDLVTDHFGKEEEARLARKELEQAINDADGSFSVIPVDPSR
jgi:hypothetical protein